MIFNCIKPNGIEWALITLSAQTDKNVTYLFNWLNVPHLHFHVPCLHRWIMRIKLRNRFSYDGWLDPWWKVSLIVILSALKQDCYAQKLKLCFESLKRAIIYISCFFYKLKFGTQYAGQSETFVFSPLNLKWSEILVNQRNFLISCI